MLGVWSFEGPVPDVGVEPVLKDQSKLFPNRFWMSHAPLSNVHLTISPVI